MNSAQSPLKIVTLGEGGVGKTALIERLFDDFHEQYIATIGVQLFNLVFQTTHGSVFVTVWDTAGQERFSGIRDGYMIGSQGAVILTDLTDPATIVQVQKWHVLVQRVCGDVPVVFVGNKRDALIDGKPQTPNYVSSHNLPFFITSARNREDAFAPFQFLLR